MIQAAFIGKLGSIYQLSNVEVRALRILMLTQFYPPTIGGEERHVKNLSIALACRGHDVGVATLATTVTASSALEDGVRVFRLQGTLQKWARLFSEGDRPHAPPFPDPGLASSLRRVIAEFRPDIIHAHNWLLHSFLPLKAWSGAKLVVTLHDLSLVCAKKNMMHDGGICSGPAPAKCLHCAGEHYGRTKGAVVTASNWLSGKAERRLVDKFLAVSNAIAKGNGLDQSNVPYEVVPNFVPDDIAELSGDKDPRLAELPREPYLLYVGDLTMFKGVTVLIEAYRRLVNAPPLVMIGRMSPEMPIALPPNVHVFGSWPHSAVMQAWQRSLIGIVPSILPEACATVVMECMAMGKPLVATNVGGTPDLVEDNVSAKLVAPGDGPALAAALQELIDDPAARARLAEAARQRIHSLQAKTVVLRIERIYEGLVPKMAVEMRNISQSREIST